MTIIGVIVKAAKGVHYYDRTGGIIDDADMVTD